MSRRRVAKHACDGCKIRKIKCTESSPCEGCLLAGIACTFVKHPKSRGPRNLRDSTLQEIQQTQQQWEDTVLAATTATAAQSLSNEASNAESLFTPSQIASVVLQLCVYRLRMYPVWPIIKVERLIAALQKPEPDIEVFALAYAVAAATIAQIKTSPSTQPGAVTAQMMESQCQQARARIDPGAAPTITTLRVAFFLHAYFENLSPGGLQSVLYLREAITISQMLHMHHESYYAKVPVEEQQIRRRTFWLLFITERGVSLHHKLPVVLSTKIAFPSTDDTDEADVLLAFQTIISLFWELEASSIFTLLDQSHFGLSALADLETWKPRVLDPLITKLSQFTFQADEMNDVQTADISVTLQWMRVILWRLTRNGHASGELSPAQYSGLHDPVWAAKECIAAISRLPSTALEAHGRGIELKIFEIASSLVDAVVLGSTVQQESASSAIGRHRDLLTQLQKLLARNQKLSSMLREKIWKSQQNQESFMHTSHGNQTMTDAEIISHPQDWGLQLELQTPDFDSNESPQEGATVDDRLSPSNLPMNHRLGSPQNPFHPTWDPFNQLSADQQAQSQVLTSVWNGVQQPMANSSFSRPQDVFDQLQDFVPGP